jgi:hypothetical protein
MSKSVFWAQSNNTSDANFRLWGKGLSDAMTAVGFTKTADTGQIDWTTVAKPAGASTFQGYEIRAFTDDLQASNPVVVKIEFGSGAGSATYPGLQITVGRASDGAGTLVGEVTNAAPAYKGSQGTGSQPCFVSGSTDRIEAVLYGDSTAYAFAFWIERVKDDTGAATELGVDFGYKAGASTYQVFFPKKGLQFPVTAVAGLPCLVPYSGGAFSYVGNLGLFPIYTNIGYIANPNLAAIVYDSASIVSAGSIITVSIFGANHDYVISQVLTGTINGNSTATICIALRYE